MLSCLSAHGLLLLAFSFRYVCCDHLTDLGVQEYAHPSISGGHLKRLETDNLLHLFGAMRETVEQRSQRPTVRHEDFDDQHLPESFDARTNWPHCPSISEIRDQSSWGSCCTFGAVEAMSDRLCIHSKGAFNKSLSAVDLTHGIVTGGSKECRSYPFPSCEHRGKGQYPPCPHQLYPTPECIKHCDTKEIDYEKDKTRANISYNVYPAEQAIMKEIMLRGPVGAIFHVYEDFQDYKSGVYFHVWGGHLGEHGIRILGWGEEDGVPYWLIANSWNEDWSEKGYMRVLRGRNECGIADQVTAGLPDLSTFSY
ncbi:hypothetical protein CRM22_007235 [Opisthorchis felineus]|uniref:Peptidase C1A papain C-terminal domain-containing protein n=1 Tax=Opisthorchis felineus TaxID=147828 RepID=A0A4S2LHA5_OPIFE|nr:hypothetical protein CRM22_007235 [Opisthorchis felineus]